MENRTIGVAILGLGTVGLGTWKVLNAQKDEMVHKLGATAEVKKILVRNVAKAAERTGHPELITNDWQEILNDPSIEIVIELMGGIEPARTYIGEALAAGKHVVTANKDLIASDHGHLMEVAKQHGCDLMFEAAVAGAIPVITPLKQSLAANHLTEVMGIVNGTTNYMLTRMDEDSLEYDAALKEAQERGFAEADPTADVDGLDAAAKIAILASIAFNSRVTMDQVFTEGIRRISPIDLANAHDSGYVVKLVAHARRGESGVDVRVHPTMIPEDHQLATVNGVFNAIFVEGDAVGQTMFFGEGAGAGPAASAVMGDVLEVARHVQMGIKPIVGCTCTDNLPIAAIDDLETKYYIRFVVADRPGVLAACADIFAKNGVSVRTVTQRGNAAREDVNLVFVTHTAKERDVRKTIDEILALEGIVTGGEPSVIRVQG